MPFLPDPTPNNHLYTYFAVLESEIIILDWVMEREREKVENLHIQLQDEHPISEIWSVKHQIN